MTNHLITWQALELKMTGSELEPILRSKLKEAGAPVSELELAFGTGEMRITGKARTFLTIPFEVVIREIRPEGKTVIIPIHSVSAGGFPVPKLLSSLFDRSAARGGILVDGSGPKVTVLLDRFLPQFLEVELDEILIVEDGLLIRTGSGGADLPEGV